MMKKIGFLINPIAGMGGSVGLKGTDNVLEESIKRGAKPVSEKRALETLRYIKKDDFIFLSCKGSMGEGALRKEKFKFEIIYKPENTKRTSREDTIRACKKFLERDVEMILFCGGDGTARDIYSIIKDKIPLIGIPSGVKMYSAVFSINPLAAAKLFNEFIEGKLKITEAEIMDIDEDKYRNDILDSKLYGYAKIPYKKILIQKSKSIFYSESDEENKKNIAKFAIEFMRDGSLYIIGAGSTTKKIFDLLGIKKTLLGVDAVKDGKLIGRDLNEKEILRLLDKYPKAKIIVSPIGVQGFIFGRGNQQISAEVIKRVGIENIIIIATQLKLSETENLLVDTGDKELDKKLSGYKSVVCDYRMAQRKNIISLE